MKKQIVIIHGGDSFKTYKEYLSFLRGFRIDINRYRSGKKDWKSTIEKALGKNFEVILPVMPNKTNAQYKEWVLWFKKFLPHIKPDAVFVGHSLGGQFLAKYLSDYNAPKGIRGAFFVAAPYETGDFTPPKTFKRLEKLGRKIFLYHSKDDPVVQFSALKKYQKKLPSAVVRVFHNRKHFNQETLPELVKDIKNLY